MPPSGRYMPSSSERYDIYLRGPVRPPFLFSGVPGQMRWASASGRCRTDSPIAGRVGEKHFFSRIGAIRFGTSRAFPARTRVTFPSPEKSPKGRIREGPFRWGPSLMNPSPTTTQRGARVGTSSASLILPQASGFGRCAAPPSSSANAALVCLGAAPSGPFLPIPGGLTLFDGGSAFQGCGAGGESKEGAAAPSLVVAGGGS